MSEDFVRVATITNPGLAEIVKNALENEEIPCFLNNQHQGGLVGVLNIEVLVPAVHAERAAALIAEHEPLEDDPELEDEPDLEDDSDDLTV